MVTPIALRNLGFSLIEVLMVVAIIAVLSALIVASSGAFSGGSKQARTDAILGAVRSGLEMSLADSGTAATPAEHPLAASLAPRLNFIRSADGSAVATAGLALAGVSPDQVAAGFRSRVLHSDDIFNETAAPHLYGMQRSYLGILGVPQADVTRLRKLPSTIALAANPDSTAAFPDHLFLVAPNGVPADQAAHLDRLLGTTGASELAALGGLRAPPADYTHAIMHGRLRTNIVAGSAGPTRWEGGHVQDGSHAGHPNWKPIRLPGVALYDGFGTELLYRFERGAITVMSAGKDRVFRWHPGEDDTLATAADATAPAGDDRDGSPDNRIQGSGD